MAIDRITTGAVLDGAIATADIADDAITTAKLPNDAVTSAKIADGTIATANIADDAITGAKIENNPTIAGNLAAGGTLTVTGESTLNGNLNISASSFDGAGAHLKVGGQLRPQVNFRSTWGSYTHTFSGSSVSNYTDTTGQQTHPPYNGVYGQNTTGAVTSSTPGQSYYKIPYTGIYFMSFSYLVNTQVTFHFDATFNIQSVNSFNNSATAYVGPSGGAFGTQFEGLASYTDFTNSNNLARGNQSIGFNRKLDADGIAGAMGCTICNFFQKDMVIRPQICGNASGTANIYGVNHSHWSIVYLGR
tara:strand:+ start:35 stop:946 length:912 start_codon:yes stop_codon:yes gene_type:complete